MSKTAEAAGDHDERDDARTHKVVIIHKPVRKPYRTNKPDFARADYLTDEVEHDA